MVVAISYRTFRRKGKDEQLMDVFLGVDGGGSKTLAIVVDESGRSLGVGLGGPGNFQGPGVEKARLAVQESIEQALNQAGAELHHFRGAYFGMAGADRPADFEIVRNLIRPNASVNPLGF